MLLLYAGDYASAKFRPPGNRETLGSVDVRVMWAIKLKNGRIDYQFGDVETQPCLHAIFPHLGYTPCWYLTRHKIHEIKVGDAGLYTSSVTLPCDLCRDSTRTIRTYFLLLLFLALRAFGNLSLAWGTKHLPETLASDPLVYIRSMLHPASRWGSPC